MIEKWIRKPVMKLNGFYNEDMWMRNLKDAIKWWFKIREDKKLLGKLQNKLNGHVYKTHTIDGDIIFNGESQWRDSMKRRLDHLVAKREKSLKTYSKEFIDRTIKEAEELYDKYVVNCIELQDRITALRFEIYGDDEYYLG